MVITFHLTNNFNYIKNESFFTFIIFSFIIIFFSKLKHSSKALGSSNKSGNKKFNKDHNS